MKYRIIGEIKWWQKIIKFNHPHLISTIPNPQAVITTDASPIVWGATFQIVEQNIKIKEKRKIKKLSQEKKNQTILSEKGNLYCPTSLMTSK
jgi:hypothetical protein